MPGYWNLRARANESDTLPTREQDYFFLVVFFSSFSWSFVYMYESEEGRRAEMKMRGTYLFGSFLYHM